MTGEPFAGVDRAYRVQQSEVAQENAKRADAALDSFDNTARSFKEPESSFTGITEPVTPKPICPVCKLNRYVDRAAGGGALYYCANLNCINGYFVPGKPEPSDVKLKPKAEFAHNHQSLDEALGCHTCQARATLARLKGSEAEPEPVKAPCTHGRAFSYCGECDEVKAEPTNQMYQSMKATFAKCLGICERKNNDYSRGDASYRNFETVTRIGVSVQQGILIRTLDKITRLENLLTVAPYVTEETFEDTIDDAINYLAILKARREYERNSK